MSRFPYKGSTTIRGLAYRAGTSPNTLQREGWVWTGPRTMIRLCFPICGGTPCKYFYCQDYISPQNACQTNQIDEVRVGFMQQASRWGEHDRGEKGEHERGKPSCMDYPHHDLMVHATS